MRFMSFVYKYPHPAVTTDCVILTFHEDTLKILLIRRGIEPFKGAWALPGGFLKMDESAEQCALRELQEETGVTGCTIKQFHTFSSPNRDPRERVITIAFYALMKWQQAKGADDAEFADWIPLNALPPLAFDHAEIIKMALKVIKRDIYFEPVGFELLNEIFSMSELQRVYESILGKEFDRRNFAKKMKHLDILEPINEEDDKSEYNIEPEYDLLTELPTESSAVQSDYDGSFEKTLPLPFLNRPFHQRGESKEENFANFGMNAFGGNNIFNNSDLIKNDVSYESEVLSDAKPKTRKKRTSFWRLNRKKYDEIKDEDTFEF